MDSWLWILCVDYGLWSPANDWTPQQRSCLEAALSNQPFGFLEIHLLTTPTESVQSPLRAEMNLVEACHFSFKPAKGKGCRSLLLQSFLFTALHQPLPEGR